MGTPLYFASDMPNTSPNANRWNMVTLDNLRIGFALGMSISFCLFNFHSCSVPKTNAVSGGIWVLPTTCNMGPFQNGHRKRDTGRDDNLWLPSISPCRRVVWGVAMVLPGYLLTSHYINRQRHLKFSCFFGFNLQTSTVF